MPPKRKRKAAVDQPASSGTKAKRAKASAVSLETGELDETHPVVYIEHCKS